MPPSAPSSADPIVQRAPTLYTIAVFKVGKGVLFTLLALGVYTLSDNNLSGLFRSFLEAFHLDPERSFFVHLSKLLKGVTESNMVRVAAGTFVYSLVAWVEGIGLLLRLPWAGWLAIVEGAFFIPIEIYELSRVFRMGLAVIMVLNIGIVWYLYRNRHRLFRPHAHDGRESQA